MAMILVMDDNSVRSRFLQQVLTRKGHAVILASSGIEGITLARGMKFDLVITGGCAPGMNGLETFKTIRSVHSSLKAIFMGGSKDFNLDLEFNGFRRHGLAEVIQTPFKLKDIEKVVERLISDSR